LQYSKQGNGNGRWKSPGDYSQMAKKTRANKLQAEKRTNRPQGMMRGIPSTSHTFTEFASVVASR